MPMLDKNVYIYNLRSKNISLETYNHKRRPESVRKKGYRQTRFSQLGVPFDTAHDIKVYSRK